MKKIIIIISVAVVAIGATIAGIVSLKSNTISKETDIYSSFPEVPVSIIQINNPDELTQALLYNNNYWQDLSHLEQLKTINTVFTLVDSLKETNPDISNVLQNRKLVLSTYADGKSLWSTQVSDNEQIAIKSILSNNISNKLYFAYPADILLISDDKSLIEKSIMQISSGVSLMDTEEGFNKIKASAGEGALVNWFVNIKAFQNTLNESFKEQFNLHDINHYARWCGLDIETLEDKIVVNGFAESGGEQDFLSVFSAQEYTLNTLTSRMPYNTYFFKHYALSDVDEYTQAVDSFSNKHELGYNAYGNLVSLETNTGENPLLFFRQFFDGEIAYGRTPMNEFVIVKLFSPQEAAEKLNYMVNDKDSEAKLIKKNGLDIYHFNQNGFAASVFGKQFLLEDEYMTIVDNKLIIAPTINFLTYIASRNANTQTLQCAPNFRDANKTLLSIANLSFYVNIPYVIRNAKEFFSEDFTAEIKKNENLWKNFSTFCLQAENSPNGNTFQHFFLQYDRVHELIRNEDVLLNVSEKLGMRNEINQTKNNIEQETDETINTSNSNNNDSKNVVDNQGNLIGDGSDFIQWTPIGVDNRNMFQGNFNGNGHTVSGLYFNDPKDDCVGLIGAGKSCTIKNVGVVNSYFGAVDDIGAILGFNYRKVTILNCFNLNTTIIKHATTTDGVGGITGYVSSYSSVNNCFSTGKVNIAITGGIPVSKVYDSKNNYYLDTSSKKV